MLIEASIIGRMMDVSARMKRLLCDRLVLAFAPLSSTGSKEATMSTTGMARNLVISLRLARDLNSFAAIANATGSNQSRDFP